MRVAAIDYEQLPGIPRGSGVVEKADAEKALLELNTCAGAVKPTINSRFPDLTFAASLALSRA
ncbi:hypothetical protein FHS21_004277 [Phyllobacterium trifolii]|uniref:Uncharacterized protein n=1 Tax=Phyllobacterium trifolii TaxID=300193 RepID=A0A839UGA7_9HYPH|nr:hypothetical protein [Phyllobacterium trifolii]MBB3147842.1 hypothetical protein [Phyllobacterium trifolii]